jgi:hypothetical protein
MLKHITYGVSLSLDCLQQFAHMPVPAADAPARRCAHLQSAWVLDPQLEAPSSLGINALVLDLDRVPPEAAAGAPDGPLGLPCVRQLGMLIASGGAAPGYGNPPFLSTRNPSPKFAMRGYEGERVTLGLELKRWRSSASLARLTRGRARCCAL